MSRRRVLALAPVLLAGSLAAVAPGLTAAATAAASITLAPDLHARLASQTSPLSTAQCETKYHLACYEPAQVQKAYGVASLLHQGIDGAGQTIVIVDSFGSPTIGNDLTVFDKAFGLQPPPAFTVIQPAGPVPAYTASNAQQGWAGETTLDVEWAHAMAPRANILLVETPVSENEGTSGFPQIVKAEEYVIDHQLGGVISQSFSATEETFPTKQSLLDLRGAYTDAAHRGISVLTASGDSGAADVDASGHYYAQAVTSWPDSDPLVTGVGGTAMQLDSTGKRLAPDEVWNETNSATVNAFFGSKAPYPSAGGGGSSVIFGRPSYQDAVKGVVGAHRGVPDVSLSASCDGAVDTYQSYGGAPAGWYLACGTSEATPLFAGIVALADQAAGHPLGNLNPALYALAAAGPGSGLVDVTSGDTTVSYRAQGAISTVSGATAAAGYDLASGLGTVDAATLVPALAAYAKAHP